MFYFGKNDSHPVQPKQNIWKKGFGTLMLNFNQNTGLIHEELVKINVCSSAQGPFCKSLTRA